jgi:hypothetical protein
MAADDSDEWPVLPPASLVNTTVGPLLAAVMIEHLLLGIACSQASTYFHRHFEHDSLFIRSIVVCLVVTNAFFGITSLYACISCVVL